MRLGFFAPFHLTCFVFTCAEATVSMVKALNGLIELCRVKVRPQGVGKVQLTIGDVPQQEVANSKFTTGAN